MIVINIKSKHFFWRLRLDAAVEGYVVDWWFKYYLHFRPNNLAVSVEIVYTFENYNFIKQR